MKRSVMSPGTLVVFVSGLAAGVAGFAGLHGVGAAPAQHGPAPAATAPAQRGPAPATTAAERQAITATVQLYFQGHATGDGELFRKAFHPDARLFWVKDGALAQRTSAEFAAGASGKPAPDEARRVRAITLIDVAGDAAIARVELHYPDVSFVDYLSLLKLDGSWRIVNKIFHRAPPRAALRSSK